MSNFSNYDNVNKNNSNNLRMMEINEYYSKRNTAFIEIFKIIIVGAIPLIILAILTKSNIIPKQITVFLSLIITFILVVICLIKFYYIAMRDPRNFDNFTIPFNAHATELEDSGKLSSMSDILNKEFHGTINSLETSLSSLGCFDQHCCSNDMTFDKHKKKCVLDSSDYKDNNYINSVDKLTNSNKAQTDLNNITNDLRNFTIQNIHKEM